MSLDALALAADANPARPSISLSKVGPPLAKLSEMNSKAAGRVASRGAAAATAASIRAISRSPAACAPQRRRDLPNLVAARGDRRRRIEQQHLEPEPLIRAQRRRRGEAGGEHEIGLERDHFLRRPRCPAKRSRDIERDRGRGFFLRIMADRRDPLRRRQREQQLIGARIGRDDAADASGLRAHRECRKATCSRESGSPGATDDAA